MLVVAAMQLLLVVIATPMIRLLYNLVLVEIGLGSVAYDRISQPLRNPLADVTLLIIAIVAVIAIIGELVTCLCWHRTTRPGNAISPVWCSGSSGRRLPTVPSPRLLIVYLIFAAAARARTDVDLDQEGGGTTIHQRGAEQEPHVQPRLQRGASGDHLPESPVDLHLPLLGTTTGRVGEAFVTSWRLTRWRSLRILGLVFVLTSWQAGRVRLGCGDFGTDDCH